MEVLPGHGRLPRPARPARRAHPHLSRTGGRTVSTATARRASVGVTFVVLVALSNYLTDTFGMVSLGVLEVTAGTFTAGLVLLARDGVHELGGVRVVLGCILAGAVISAVWTDN